MTFDEWAVEYFGRNVDVPEACRDAWVAAREQCAAELEAKAAELTDGDTDADALRGAADMLRSNAELSGAARSADSA
jgi:hypothetical protein